MVIRPRRGIDKIDPSPALIPLQRRDRRRIAQGGERRHRCDDTGGERALRSIVGRARTKASTRSCAAWWRRPASRRRAAAPARLHRKRQKKGSNKDWTHPKDPDVTITRIDDGRTHFAHKAEHAVDLETGAVVGVTVQDASAGDTTTMVETLITAAEHVEAVLPAGGGMAEVVAGQGLPQQQDDGRTGQTGTGRLRAGARPWPATLARQTRRPPRRVCQPAADPEAPRTATDAPARRAPRATARPALRDRAPAPSVLVQREMVEESQGQLRRSRWRDPRTGTAHPAGRPDAAEDRECPGMPYRIHANVNNGKGQRGLQSSWRPPKTVVVPPRHGLETRSRHP